MFMRIRFSKYQALGNAYIVVPAGQGQPTTDEIRRLCDFRMGIGSDGVLLGPYPADDADFGLRIINPDGSEAEKSGNGLRIFCQYLYDHGLVSTAAFTIKTRGGIVQAQVFPERQLVRVAMGKVSFHSSDIPVNGPPREVLLEEIVLAGEKLAISCATIGNPHCVVLSDVADEAPTEALARRLGPLLENYALFPNRSNVQFARVIDRQNLQLEIWERGAGYTYASGSSSCAAAAVVYKLGLVDAALTVHMRGGQIDISISPDFEVVMTGPVVSICSGLAEASTTEAGR
ncbi:diaminopimelate epimerase [Undibacterium sp. TS12]|uniref:diaminopimelate epimerase n=1 Tax=Undibacterium sp. TS12 TaxID=2908202 RepID=UPI001F4C6CED|nr:diaminopimelate epimerase [Undibacterium sp. TS12]MCH8617529.1 diaminopimelate epimerase [Undibacterium sp. TS12]